MALFQIEILDIVKMENQLREAKESALPFATRFTLNKAVMEAQKEVRLQARNQLTLRNKFTEKSIQFDRAKGLNIRNQMATVGSVASYFPDIEFGQTKTKKGSEGVPIATSYSSGEGETTRPRKRLPRKPNRLRNIQLRSNRIKAASKRQRNYVTIQQAAKSGRKFVFLDLQNDRKGIFKVIGGRRRPDIKMVHDLSRQSVTVKPRPVFSTGVNATAKKIPDIYRKALEFQFKRHKLFGH